MFKELFEEEILDYMTFISIDATYDLRQGLANMYANDIGGFKAHLKREYKSYKSSPKKYMDNLTKYQKGR